MDRLHGQTAVVTGGTRGVGRGIALELARQGASVFVTGRSVDDVALGHERLTGIRCDHRSDTDVAAAFAHVLRQAGRIDILVNNVWGGYEHMVEDGAFTWTKPFWEQPLWRWDAMFSAGVRAHYQASQLAARFMVASRHGLIVNISFWAAQKHIGNVAYGVSKAATDKMTPTWRPSCGRTASRWCPSTRTRSDREGHGSRGVAGPERTPSLRSSSGAPSPRWRLIPTYCGILEPSSWPLASAWSTASRTSTGSSRAR